MSLSLRNMQKQMQVINLPHEFYCKAAGSCSCVEQTITLLQENALTGDRSPRSEIRRLPGSITLLAHETREGLSEAILEVPQVKRALEQGQLRVLTQKTPPVPKARAGLEARLEKERDKEKNA